MIALIRPDKLAAQVAAARREWEELDPAYTSHAMRRKAEQRYLSLLRLEQADDLPAVQVGLRRVAAARPVTP